MNSSSGVRTIAIARTIRWIGWGFGEPLLPVFIAMFAATFAQAGVIRSVYDLITLLALPIVGRFADKYPARTLILVALLLYPLIGVGYFLAGITGFAGFIVVTRLLNGALWAVESVGVDTYYRRMTPVHQIGSAFGYIDMLANFGWILAALTSIWLATFIPIHWLLLAIAPFAFGAYLIARKVAPDSVEVSIPAPLLVRSSVQAFFTRFKGWNARMYMLGVLIFVTDILGTVPSFFVPIYVYQETGSTTEAVLIAVVAAIPSLLGYHLGKLVDTTRERNILVIGLSAIILSFLTAYFFKQWLLVLAVVFVIEIGLELLSLAQKSYITKFCPSSIWGERGSTMHALGVIGGMLGPILVGMSFDILNPENTFLILSVLTLVLLIAVWFVFQSEPK